MLLVNIISATSNANLKIVISFTKRGLIDLMKMDRVIDVHAHIVFPESMGKAGSYGPEMGVDSNGVSFFRFGGYTMKPMDYRNTVFMDVSMRVDGMAQHGIDLQLLSPNPLTLFHHIGVEEATMFCQVQNDAMAKLVSQYPDKFLGAAALPMQDIGASIKEAERVVKQLGLSAIYIGTNLPYDLDDPCLDEFYMAIIALNVPLFFHPASTGGVSGPDDARLARFDMTLILGYAYEETIAVAQLVLGGVLDRHPKLDICLSHGAGVTAYLIPKFEGWAKVRDWAPDSVQELGFTQVCKKLWFDAHVSGTLQKQLLIDSVGADRCVYGTNFGGWDTPANADEFARSLTVNTERLLRLNT